MWFAWWWRYSAFVAIAGMPVDLFPTINLPQVVVATFYSGMPPQDIEANITAPLERFFTLASGIDHMESHSILGVSMIRVFFQPNTSADADVTELSNLALADLKRLPPGTLPPVVLKSDASSLPVCLVAVSGAGLNETQLHDFAQFAIRNQIVTVPGVSIPATFGGKYRQIMVRVDPYKLLSRDLSIMDVVHAVNNQNLILPAGDVKMGPFDYYLYSNSLVDDMAATEQCAAESRGRFVGPGKRCRRGRRLQRHAIQHRARRRTEVLVHSDSEAGRRYQHDSGGGRCAQPARDISTIFRSR